MESSVRRNESRRIVGYAVLLCSMQLALKLFGPEARIVGRPELMIDVEKLPIQCSKLRQRILEEEPRLGRLLATARFAVNFDFVGEDHLVGANDEVAIINQVCGG